MTTGRPTLLIGVIRDARTQCTMPVRVCVRAEARALRIAVRLLPILGFPQTLCRLLKSCVEPGKMRVLRNLPPPF